MNHNSHFLTVAQKHKNSTLALLFSFQVTIIALMLSIEILNRVILNSDYLLNLLDYDISIAMYMLRVKIWAIFLIIGDFLIGSYFISFFLKGEVRYFPWAILLCSATSGLLVTYYPNNLILSIHIVSTVTCVFFYTHTLNQRL